MYYITEDVINAIEPDSFNLNSCLSFSEMAENIGLFAHDEFNSLIESIGLNEVAVFESTGSLIVYEGAHGEKIKEKVKNTISKIVAAVKSFWDKVILHFSKKDNSKLIEAFNNADLSKIPSSTEFGVCHNFENLGKINYASNGRKVFKQINLVYDKLIKAGATDKAYQAMEELNKDMYKLVSTVDAQNSGKIKKPLKEKLIGKTVKVDVNFVKRHKKDIIDALDTKSIVEKIKALYKDELKMYSDFVDEIIKLDASLDDIIDAWTALLGLLCHSVKVCYGVESDVHKRRYTEYGSIAYKVIRAAEK